VTNGPVQGTVVAVPPPATGTLTTFCGAYTGDTHGTLVMVRKGDTLLALVAEAGAAAEFALTGTITGSAVFFQHHDEPPDNGTTTVVGTIAGGTVSGTWTYVWTEPGRGQLTERGDWLVRAGNCPF